MVLKAAGINELTNHEIKADPEENTKRGKFWERELMGDC